jgi:hypothetical protein
MPVTLTGEWKTIGRQTGLAGSRRRGLILLVLVAVMFGVYLPYAKGFDFLDVLMLTAYALLSGVFAGPAAIGLVAPPSPYPSPGEARIKVLAAALHGWVVAAGIAFLGIVAVNAFHWIGRPVLPPAKVLLGAAAVALCCSAWIAALGVALGLRFPPLSAQGILRLIFLAVLGLLVFREQIFPAAWLEAGAVRLTVEGYTALAAVLCAVLAGLALASLAIIQVIAGKRA